MYLSMVLTAEYNVVFSAFLFHIDNDSIEKLEILSEILILREILLTERWTSLTKPTKKHQ